MLSPLCGYRTTWSYLDSAESGWALNVQKIFNHNMLHCKDFQLFSTDTLTKSTVWRLIRIRIQIQEVKNKTRTISEGFPKNLFQIFLKRTTTKLLNILQNHFLGSFSYFTSWSKHKPEILTVLLLLKGPCHAILEPFFLLQMILKGLKQFYTLLMFREDIQHEIKLG